MQVSSVGSSVFSSVDISESINSGTISIVKYDTVYNAFMSTPGRCDSSAEIDSIYEWKSFCQNQIMANNLDYIV